MDLAHCLGPPHLPTASRMQHSQRLLSPKQNYTSIDRNTETHARSSEYFLIVFYTTASTSGPSFDEIPESLCDLSQITSPIVALATPLTL